MRRFVGRLVSGVFAVLVSANAFGAESLVTFRPEATLTLFDAAYRADSRETADPDAWRYLKPEVKGAVQYLERKHGFKATVAYSAVMRGFAADLSDAQIQALRHEPMIESIAVTVEVASVAWSEGPGQTVPWGVRRVLGAESPSTNTRTNADAEPERTSPGVTAYVLDSGIDADTGDLNVARHVNFAGSVTSAECRNHGTHVAGTIGALDNDIGVVGVAAGASLVDVRVINCRGAGTSAGVLKGLDWIAATAKRPAVVNMSFGGGHSPLLDTAVQKVAALGLFVAISAGNTASDACLSSPSLNGSSMGIMTVSAAGDDESEAGFSNFGACVDMWAPGMGIESTAPGAIGTVATYSGTSMAAPHVAGAAALYLSAYPKSTPAEVESALIASSAIPGTASKDGRTILRLQIAPR